jgi:hypothetical protein
MDDVQFKAGNLSGRARIFVAGFPRYILLSCNGRKLRIGYSFTYDILLFVKNIHCIKVSLSWNRKSAYSCYAYTNTNGTEGDERCRIVWGSFGKERHQHDDNKEHRFSWMNVTVLWNVMPGYLLDIISTNILFQFSVGIWFLRNVRRYLLSARRQTSVHSLSRPWELMSHSGEYSTADSLLSSSVTFSDTGFVTS